MLFEINHTFDCDLATYERLFLDSEYLRFLEKTVPNVQKIEILSCDEQGPVVKRRVRYSPKPGSYKVGPKTVPTEWTVFEEESSFDRERHEMRFSNHPHIPSILRDKFSNNGTVRLTADGPGRTRRSISGEIRVRIFLLGKIAERIIHRAGADLIEQEAKAMKAWVAERKGA
jgi:hypothetical protein